MDNPTRNTLAHLYMPSTEKQIRSATTGLLALHRASSANYQCKYCNCMCGLIVFYRAAARSEAARYNPQALGAFIGAEAAVLDAAAAFTVVVESIMGCFDIGRALRIQL